MRLLVVSFGGDHPSTIASAQSMSWDDFVRVLLTPLDAENKTAAGWYSCGEYSPEYRNSANLKLRHALAFDFDTATLAQLQEVRDSLKGYAYVAYTTASHTAEKPRIRIVLPTDRAMTPEEFCAISRKVASWSNIEYASRESHVPAQMMYLPTLRDGGSFKGKIYQGDWLKVDEILASYKDWRDRDEWPHRDADSVHFNADDVTPPRDKPGVIGAFCRAYSITEAIEAFDLPYDRVR